MCAQVWSLRFEVCNLRLAIRGQSPLEPHNTWRSHQSDQDHRICRFCRPMLGCLRGTMAYAQDDRHLHPESPLFDLCVQVTTQELVKGHILAMCTMLAPGGQPRSDDCDASYVSYLSALQPHERAWALAYLTLALVGQPSLHSRHPALHASMQVHAHGALAFVVDQVDLVRFA